MHNTMKRLYEVAKEKFGIEGQSDLAKKLNQSPQTLNNWEARGMSKAGILIASKALNIDAIYIESGTLNTRNVIPNTSPAPSVKGEVPVISWVQAGTWNEAMDCERQDDLNYLPCISNHSECSFALRVRGDSMTAPYGKTYPEGCIIFVDPEIRMPSSGDRIIAKVNGEAEVTFKVFMKEGEKIWLKPLNSQHPIITDEFKVLGKVIGKWEDD